MRCSWQYWPSNGPDRTLLSYALGLLLIKIKRGFRSRAFGETAKRLEVFTALWCLSAALPTAAEATEGHRRGLAG